MSNHPAPEMIMALKDGALPAEELSWVVEHTDGCPRCTGLLDEERALDAILSQGRTRISIPEALPALIAQRALAAAAAPSPHLSALKPTAIALGAMALALVLVLAPVVNMGSEAALFALGGMLKEGVMLLREVLPLFKAVLTLLRYAWLPLMVGLGLAALFPIALATRVYGPHARLRGAA